MARRKKAAEMVAGLDLGSNSFHMIVARVHDNQLHVVDRLREVVRLAAGLDDDHNITAEAQQRALESIERFGQRLKELPATHVRAVGTNTLRQAANSKELLEAANKALGHRIEIISGAEEARLIYLGVAHSLPTATGRRLVVDIGGGSTECVIGEGLAPLQRDSLFMGCVSYSRRFFPDGVIDRARLRQAELAAGLELRSIIKRFRRLGWTESIGASGTIGAVADVLRANSWDGPAITRSGVRRLKKALVTAGHVDALGKLAGLAADRGPVFPGGVAILAALIEGLGIEQLVPAQGALREGLLIDLLGRMRHEDVRDATVQHLLELHEIDRGQAGRVAATAAALLCQVARPWQLGEDDGRLLRWAALLHEIGLSVAYTGYHKHSAYLVQNSDLAGFSREDQELLAQLVRNHRRKLKLKNGQGGKTARRLAVLLRLAALLHRERSERPLPPFALAVSKDHLHLSFPAAWLERHPLTRADLEQEAERLTSSFGWTLQLS